MSERPVLLFLHGVREKDGESTWRSALDAALAGLGYPGLDHVEVIAPKYPNTLNGVDDDRPAPDTQIKALVGESAKHNRRAFERRTSGLELRLDRYRGVESEGSQVPVDLALATPIFAQARHYLTKAHVRAAVLRRIVDHLPRAGRIVILAHSLGSVVAADLLRRLPEDLRVAGLITIGSPLGNPAFDVWKIREELKEPPANLEWWVNVWNKTDPVSATRGVSAAFPWMLDLRVSSSVFPASHGADVYVAQPVVAEAVGYALFGSRAKDIVEPERGLDIPLDDSERLAIIPLRYAYLVGSHLTGDHALRYAGARRLTQADVFERIRRRNAELGRPLPSSVARLAFDASDPESVAPVPPPAAPIDVDEAVVLLTVLASDNVINPYEISVPRGATEKALADISLEMGLSTRFASGVVEAAKEARKALAEPAGVGAWLKWGALGAGAVALVAATGGLALAAAPGVAGAAAITSALAAFGPGGMIGGLLTAGALVTAGGGGIAYGLASVETSAEAVIAVVERQLTTELLRDRLGLDPDPNVWSNLVELEVQVRRQYERLDEYSDRDAAHLKDVKRKLGVVERALEVLREKGLGPGA